MRVILEVATHLALPVAELAFQGVVPLTILTAFTTAILISLLSFGHRLLTVRRPKTLVTLWALIIGTLTTWLIGVLALDAVGLVRP